MKQMKMIVKILIMVMLSSSLLFSVSLVGSWKIDKARTIKANKKENKADMKMFEHMNIYEDHTVEIKLVGLKSKLIKSAKGYHMVVVGDKVPVRLLDADHLSLQFEDIVYYVRVSNRVKNLTHFKQSQVSFKLEKIYTTQIKNDYAFMLLSEDGAMYFLQTDRKKRISIKEIKAGRLKQEKKRSGFTFANNTMFELKNGMPYIVMEDKQIEVLSSQKLKYRGNVYVLEQ